MDQIVSLVKDQQAHFAYVDHTTGQIVPFADILIPDEDRFGLVEAAGLGSSLVDFLGLNGSKRPLAHSMTVGSSLEARRRAAAIEQAENEELIALNHAPPATKAGPKATKEPKRSPGRPRKDGKPNVVRPELQAQAYIPGEWVLEVIAQYPEGIAAKDIGERIWRTKLNGGDADYPRWITRTVENRITGWSTEHNRRGTPLPFAIQYHTPEGTTLKRRLLKPLPTNEVVASDNSLFP